MRNFSIPLTLAVVLTVLPLRGQQERFRKTPPNAEPLQIFRLPQIEPAPLANGLNLGVVYREAFPLMTVELLVLAGESSAPDDLPGLATFTGRMIGRSTQFLTPSNIDEKLDALGATLTVETNPDYTRVSFRFLDGDQDRALDLLSQMILQPAFPESEADPIKLTASYDLSEQELSPEFVANAHFLRQLFENHPYRKYVFPRDAIRNWTGRDAAGFFDRFFRPNNVRVLVCGNINRQTAARNISHYFGVWQSKPVPSYEMSVLKPPDNPRVSLVDVPGANDCMVVVGTVVPPLEVADRFALTVLNQVLGGTTNSRLFLNLRESKAYAYRAFSQVDTYKAGGVFSIRALVRPDVAAESVREIEKEIAMLVKFPVSSTEIEMAKSYLIGHFPLAIASFESFAKTAAEVLAYDRGEEFWSRYYDQVMAVTPERVFAEAQALLTRPFVTVIAGDKTVLQARLTGLESFDVFDNQGRFQYHVSREKKGAENEARGMRPEFQRGTGQR